MWGWGWGGSGGGGGGGGHGSSSASSHDSTADGEVVHEVDEDPDSHAHADLAAPEVDANGAHYTDEAKALEASRQGVLPSLIHQVWGAWTEDDLTGLQLRGAGYLDDRIKIDCGPPLFRLSHIDIFHTLKEEPKVLHIAQKDNSWVKVMTAKRKQKLQHSSPPPYPMCRHCDPLCHGWSEHPLNPIFIINIVFPVGKIHMYLVQYYERRVPPADVLRDMMAKKKTAAAPYSSSSSTTSSSSPFCCDLLKDVDVERVAAFDRLLQQFLDGDDEFRDSTLKIIPRVSEGSWVVKKGVGRVPAILGKKVKQSYEQPAEGSGLSYIEVDADLATSKIAGQIVSLIKSYCKTIVVDMSFLLQGDSEDTLPESLIGGIRIHKADMDKVQHYNDNARETKYPEV